MDYFQGVVAEYLTADRAMFVNPECCISLNAGSPRKIGGQRWYCDIVAVSFRESAVFLCEVSYSTTLDKLFRRLREWNASWPGVCAALARDNSIPAAWPVRPWLFVPDERRGLVSRKLPDLPGPINEARQMPEPLVTSLETVTPWRYRSRHRLLDGGDDDV